MKKIHLLFIILLVSSLAVVISTLMQNADYASFSQARTKPEKKFTVSGFLQKSLTIDYQPLENPNIFSFYMKDKEGATVKVVLNQAKPYDFERADGVVVTGKLKDQVFYATEILMKCPSKYNEQNALAQND